MLASRGDLHSSADFEVTGRNQDMKGDPVPFILVLHCSHRLDRGRERVTS